MKNLLIIALLISSMAAAQKKIPLRNTGRPIKLRAAGVAIRTKAGPPTPIIAGMATRNIISGDTTTDYVVLEKAPANANNMNGRVVDGFTCTQFTCEFNIKPAQSWLVYFPFVMPADSINGTITGDEFIEVQDINKRVLVKVFAVNEGANTSIVANSIILYTYARGNQFEKKPIHILSNANGVQVSIDRNAYQVVGINEELANINYPSLMRYKQYNDHGRGLPTSFRYKIKSK